jgi:hypothetical protein
MDDVARSARADRDALFTLTAERMGVASSVIPEKDFWVCWLLSKLFSLEGVPRLLFKGGTSLSKAFNLIDRFSEDIDISLSREDLGFSGTDDPLRMPSRKQRTRQIEALGKACANSVRTQLHPSLAASVGSVLGDAAEILGLVERGDDQIDLEFHYPRAFDAGTYGTYVQPIVRVEIGARSDHEPKERVRMRSYAAERVPEYFRTPETEVMALAPERTFWEKATIFHSENHREVEGTELPRAWARLSRHAYDLVELDRRGVGARALARLDLLDAVARHKQAFFYTAWSRYDEARPSSFRLAPNPRLVAALRRDYEQMQPMFLETASPPTFEELLAGLEDLERRIHSAHT